MGCLMFSIKLIELLGNKWNTKVIKFIFGISFEICYIGIFC